MKEKEKIVRCAFLSSLKGFKQLLIFMNGKTRYLLLSACLCAAREQSNSFDVDKIPKHEKGK